MSLMRRRFMMPKEKNGHILPDGYQQVEYIETTLGALQAILSGVVPDGASGMFVDFEYQQFYSTWFIGSRSSGRNNRFGVGVEANKIIIGFGGYEYTNWPMLSGRTTVKLNYMNNGIFEYGDNSTSITTSFSYTGIPCSVFGQNLDNQNTSRSSLVRFFRVKLTQGADIIRDFVPCYRKSDGRVGYYDLCESVNSLTNSPFYCVNYGTEPVKGDDV